MHPHCTASGGACRAAGALGNAAITAQTPHDHRALRFCPRVEVLPGGVIAHAFRGSNAPPPRESTRGVVCGLSPRAAKRLRERLMGIDWVASDVSFLTLTYHHEWGAHWRDWKADLRRMMRVVCYRFADTLDGYLWRLEFQKRVAPHYHLILCWRKGHRPPEKALQSWLARRWNAAIGETGDLAHLAHGVKCINAQVTTGGMGKLLGYMVKDVCKSDQGRAIDKETGEIMGTGRTWGIVGNVPMRDMGEWEMDADGWAEFTRRIAAGPGAEKSWYQRSINEQWAGFTVMIDPDWAIGILKELGAVCISPPAPSAKGE